MAKRGEDPDTEFPFITNRVLEAEYKKIELLTALHFSWIFQLLISVVNLQTTRC